ncbi:MAG: DNA mismatch repair endonuclease MutL, partial [Acutalibacteraceae bacterium]
MKRINILDNRFAQLIAAGEVVERPASAFKEMIENSIDAGASRITAEISHGGIKLMRITDNGSGIYRDDVKNAFLRHATSKIKQESDLERIGSLGFRGEALASICAISEVEVITRTIDEPVGTKFCISPGGKTLLEDVGAPVGTVMTVKNLFFNVPARMKFLKKDASEANLCAGVVDKLALSHPEVSFRFVRNGKEVMRTVGDGETSSAIYGIYGKEFFSELLPIDYEYESVKIRGYISRPSFSKSVRSMQNFFVNGRYIKSRLISGALEEAYKNSIMIGKFPCCVIYLTVPFGSVDVNVHPAKTEIKFSNEKTIFEAVYYSVKTALMNSDSKKIFLSQESPFSAVFASDINKIPTQVKKSQFVDNAFITTTSKPFENIFLNSYVTPEKNKINFERNKFEENKHEAVECFKVKNEKELMTGDKIESKSGCENKCENKIEIKPEKIAEDTISSIQINKVDQNSGLVELKSSSKNQNQDAKFEFSKTGSLSSQTKIYNEAVQIDFKHETEDLRIIGEVFDCYIIIEKGNDVILIDKHAAHERIIFEKLRKNG